MAFTLTVATQQSAKVLLRASRRSASSTLLSVTWIPAAVTLRTSRATAADGQPVLLSAHANENVAVAGDAIDIDIDIDIVDTTTDSWWRPVLAGRIAPSG